ncbi:MAG: pentapeptide repeat-containing protein [Oscillospiraceae bacterium]|nr:pentapeptide repeat-containing protein [Oscillospiraceae bacterium]
MLTTMEIGGKIAVARKLKNLSQAQLADQMAVSAQAVGKWERGESMPDIITFQRIAEILGADLNYFVGENTVAAGAAPSAAIPPPTHEIADGDEDPEKPEWNMSMANWVDADFSGLHGLADRFSGANIGKCRFVASEMSGLVIRGNNIEDSDFSRADLSGCRFSGANVSRSVFVECNFRRSVFSRSNINNCDFSGADLTGVTSKWCNIKRAELGGAVLYRTKFMFSQLTETVFTGEITDCSFENCDFARVTFHGAYLRQCFFKNAKLRRAQFVGCQADRLTYAFLKSGHADLTDVVCVE